MSILGSAGFGPGPRPLRAGVVCLVAFLCLAGCRGDGSAEDSPLDVTVATAPTPPIPGPTRLVVTVRDSIGAPVDDAVVRVEGTMTHAGMQAVQSEAEASGAGQYVVPAFEFTMGGDWILLTRVELPDGRVLTHESSLRVVTQEPPGGS